MTATAKDLSALWSTELRTDLAAKRARVATSLATLKSQGSYRQAHELMIRLYDAAIAAIDEEIDR